MDREASAGLSVCELCPLILESLVRLSPALPILAQGRQSAATAFKTSFRSLCFSFGLRSFSHMGNFLESFRGKKERKGRPVPTDAPTVGQSLPLANCLLSSLLIIPVRPRVPRFRRRRRRTARFSGLQQLVPPCPAFPVPWIGQSLFFFSRATNGRSFCSVCLAACVLLCERKKEKKKERMQPHLFLLPLSQTRLFSKIFIETLAIALLLTETALTCVTSCPRIWEAVQQRKVKDRSDVFADKRILFLLLFCFCRRLQTSSFPCILPQWWPQHASRRPSWASVAQEVSGSCSSSCNSS